MQQYNGTAGNHEALLALSHVGRYAASETFKGI
jgi:hypothetical protein